jgi:hypothetical protein
MLSDNGGGYRTGKGQRLSRSRHAACRQALEQVLESDRCGR